MKIGLPGDKRKFRRGPDAHGVTREISQKKSRWPCCECCGLKIVGKRWHVGEGVWACTRCHNEIVDPVTYQGDFNDRDFSRVDFH